MDLYPLHFMRHQLYFFIPFVFLFSLGLNGLESAAGKLPGAGRSRLYALCCVCLAVYAALNARAALGFNGELRTNDRELAFLAEAQRAWPPDRLVVFPRGNRTNSRFELIAKYFPPMPDCAGGTTGKLLKYVSPEPAVFSYNTAFFSTDALDQAPLIAGPGASPWRTTSFKHAFYTGLFRSADPMEETREPKQLTIGFFNIEDRGRDKALLDVLSGVCALDSGDYSGAAGKFQLAAADDRTCLNCKYFLAIARAALGEKAAAEAELAKIDKALPAALSREQRGLVKELELGETEKAAGLALAITDRNPEFFFRKDIAGALRARLSPRVQ